MVKAKRLGQKTGAGFYRYVKNKPKPDAAGIAPFLQAARKEADLVGDLSQRFSDHEIVEMVLYPVINESFRVLDEGHVLRASDIDIVSIMGYGFPAYRGGVMFWAQLEGLKHVRDRLAFYSSSLGR